MTDEAAFLAAILDRPWDDTPREVYADWLDDHGDPARAEFIRLGVQIANAAEHCYHDLTRPPDCPACQRHERAADLAKAVVANAAGDHDQLAWERWADLPGFACLNLVGDRAANGIEARSRERGWGGGNYFRFRRGMVDELRVASLDVLLGGEYRCGVRPEAAARLGIPQFARHYPDRPGTGRTPGRAREVFARHPVTRVVVADRGPIEVPTEDGDPRRWAWWDIDPRPDTDQGTHPASNLPPDVFARLPGEAIDGDHKEYPSEAAALDALSHALVDHCRGRVGLGPLYGPKWTDCQG